MNKKVKTSPARPRVRASATTKTPRTPASAKTANTKSVIKNTTSKTTSRSRAASPKNVVKNTTLKTTSRKTSPATSRQATPKTRKTSPAKSAKTAKSPKNLRKVLYYHRISVVARAICVIAFASLIFVGVSQMVRAFSLEQVDNQNGIPSSWGLTSAASPDTIEVPITYWDQHRDCKMFEFSYCNISNAKKQGGLEQGIVKDYLGADGLPIPTQETANSRFYPTDQAITGHDPVQSTDNFYRWFHAVSGQSFKYDRTLTFTRVGDTNEYTYGGRQIFPLDDVASATQKLLGHNFHFTAHLSVPVKVTLTGNEVFDFSGDDDVWVFLNNRLVLDIGGVHTAIDGHFIVNADGSVTSYVDGKDPVQIDLGLQKGEVINLDFFYAERNTSEANTRITISDMEWPISADAKLSSQVIDNKIIEYTASVTNRDPKNEITVDRVAAYLSDQNDVPGFIPLTAQTLSYSMNNSLDPSEWQQLEVSAPANSEDGFSLIHPVHLAKYGETGDTLYVRYYVAPEAPDIDYISTISFYTEDLASNSGISYDTVTNSITNLDVIVPGDDPSDEPGDEPNNNPGDDPNDNPGDNPGDDPNSDPGNDPADDPNSGNDPSDQPGDNSGDDPNQNPNNDPADDSGNGNSGNSDNSGSDNNSDNNSDDNNNSDNSGENNNSNNNSSRSGNAAAPSKNPGTTTPSTPAEETPTPTEPDNSDPATDPSEDETKGTGGNTAPTTPSNDSTDPVVPTDEKSDEVYQAPNTAPAYADDTDDDDPFSTYLPVLGTVHYTPNTGVVTQLLSTPFNNQAFSSVILSQPFLLANLAVFAISFAVFYPLRRY